MIETVIFDMDGLLVDSEPLWQRARIEAFGADRLHWTEHDQERVMGSSTLGWATYLYEKMDHEYPIEEIIERVVDQLASYYRVEVPLLPGARELIEMLHGRVTLGLASGASTRLIHAVLDWAGWKPVFVEVISGDDMAHGKPAPDIYLEMMRRLKAAPEKTAVFEDSSNGIVSGYAAGTKVIAVPNHYHRASDDALNKAALVLPSLKHFTLDLLNTL